jgi:antitoxin component YwqK of YwqJK toxin-antitoxin module
VNVFFSQTNVYDVEETTLHLEDSIVYLRSNMLPVNGIIQKMDTLKRKVFEASFINGKKSGAIKLWSSATGKDQTKLQLVYSGNYQNGLPHGEFEWYYSSGKIMAKCNYNLGKLNGKCQGWYDVNSQLKFEENYRFGSLFGLQRYFSNDGQFLGGGNLINGNGKLVLYYSRNNLAVEVLYGTGNLDSLRRIYFDKGMLTGDRNYNVRYIKIWDQEGRIESVFSTQFNTDSSVIYYNSGEKKLQTTNVYGNEGLRTQEQRWYSNGVLARDELLLNGKVIYSKYQDENKLEIFERPYIDFFDFDFDALDASVKEMTGYNTSVFQFSDLPGIWTDLLKIGSLYEVHLDCLLFECN